jgi:hypothetical protein
MKDYPSIPLSKGQKFQEIKHAHIFDKLDGSSMRSEWTKKRGWYKHGRRRGLLDDSNPALVVVPEMFERDFAEPLARVAVKKKWKHLIVFYEFWGDQSIAGLHYEDDEKHITLFDAAADKKGIVGPKEFRKIFEGEVETAKFLGIHNFTRGFAQRVRNGEVEGITFEGVVAKAGSGHNLVRAKAKTQAWIDRVLAIHGKEKGQRLIES